MRNVHHANFRIGMHTEVNGLVCQSHSTLVQSFVWVHG